jgi:hypothetical protein
VPVSVPLAVSVGVPVDALLPVPVPLPDAVAAGVPEDDSDQEPVGVALPVPPAVGVPLALPVAAPVALAADVDVPVALVLALTLVEPLTLGDDASDGDPPPSRRGACAGARSAPSALAQSAQMSLQRVGGAGGRVTCGTNGEGRTVPWRRSNGGTRA